MLVRAIIVAVAVGGTFACTHQGPRVAAAPPPSPATAPRASTPAPAPTAAPVVGTAPLAFHRVVTYDDWIDVFPLGGDTLMIAAGAKLVRVDAKGDLHDDAQLSAGIALPWPDFFTTDDESRTVMLGEADGWWTWHVGGTWPSAAFLTLATPGMSRAPDVYRWTGDRWRPARTARKHYVAYPKAIRPWKDGSLLAWQGFYARALDLDDQCSQCPDEMYETPGYRAADRAVAAAKPLAVIAGAAKAPTVSARDLVAFDALPSGEIFVARANGSFDRIGGAAGSSTISAAGKPRVFGLLALGPTDVVIHGAIADAPYLARFDGAAIVPIAAPECAAPLVSMSIHGSQWWATCAAPPPRSYDELNSPTVLPSSLWRREGDEPWTQVVLAPNVAPQQVHVVGPDDVWLTAIVDDHAQALHSRDHGRVIVLGSAQEMLRRTFAR
jgi:hypothetical protein